MSQNSNQQELRKSIGFSAAVSTVVGILIGSGVFFKPQAIYSATNGGPGLGLLAWLIGGLITIAAGLTAAEISASIIKPGGFMVYLEEIYGEKVLILDRIQDPGNLGTIIRSAVAFNIDTIICSPDTVDFYNPKVVRASQGMMFHIPIIIKNTNEVIRNLKNNDYKIVGTKVTNGKDVREASIYSHFALIIGNEGQGISRDIEELCDEYLYIKMNENCESLNASVAASILLYEINNK